MTNKRKLFSRASRMVNLGTGIAGSYLAYQFQRPFLSEEQKQKSQASLSRKNAKRVSNELQHLRGPIMKLGQALSMQTHALAPEWIEELSRLQMQAPAMHNSLMRAQFKATLGKYPEEMFESFEPEPFAAASLGQVHFAVTKAGEKVAVKIQYPAIKEAIENDFKMLRTAALPVSVSGYIKKAVFVEVERGILEETDYLNEAKNIEHFRKRLKSLDFVHVPRVYPELSGDQVITMSRITGVPIQEFLKSKPTQAIRNKIGENLTRLFFFQLCELEALHADPHPGNYLFNPDGSIGLVDFGCVKYLKPAVVKCYTQFWSREWIHDPKLYAEIVRVIFDDPKAATDRHVRTNMNEIARFYDEFHPLDKNFTVLDLGDPHFMDSIMRLAKTLVQNKMLSPDFIFLSRTESGMCNIMHILKSRVPTTHIAREFINPPN